jgi:hypothetical protein
MIIWKMAPTAIPIPTAKNFARLLFASTGVVWRGTSAMHHPSTQFLEEKNNG